jgi:uncharacterized protein
MLFLLSPAKSLNYDSLTPEAINRLTTEPVFVSHSTELIELLKTLSVAQIMQLMGLSEALATLNAQRYASWSIYPTRLNSKPAVLAFDGDVYGGFDAHHLNLSELKWAQKHIAILSGLYGVLRPLDRLQPYRLEMGTRLTNARGSNLYAYWGSVIAQYLNERLSNSPSPIIVNLASREYFKAIEYKLDLDVKVVTCVFEEWHSDRYKIISFFAKRARGLMARYAVQQRVTTVADLKKFQLDEYRFSDEASGSDRLVFRRNGN